MHNINGLWQCVAYKNAKKVDGLWHAYNKWIMVMHGPQRYTKQVAVEQ
jgi:hypothetical protein